jgi:membrane protein required for colicin V production
MIIDTLVFVLLAIAIFKGYSKGLIIAVFSFIGLFVGLAAAVKCSAVVAGWLGKQMTTGQHWIPTLSFAIVFFAAVFLVRQGAAIVQKTVQMAMLGWVNKIGGIIFYAIIYLVLISIIVFYVKQLHIVNDATIQQSQTYPFIASIGPKAINGLGVIIPIFKDLFTQLEDFFAAISTKVSAT